MSGPLRGVASLLAAAAGAALLAAAPPVTAQSGHGDTKTLVTNLGETTDGRTEVGGEDYRAVAVRFHTAEHGLGFVLEQIRIETEAPAEGLGGVEILAAVREDVSNSIGDVAVSFAPQRARAGTTTFEAHGAELGGNRWYWLEIRARQLGKRFFVATTESDTESGEPGDWWIDNGHRQASGSYRPDWSGSLTTVDSAAKIAVLGQPKYESNLYVLTSPATEGDGIRVRFVIAPVLDTNATVSYETRIESDDTATQRDFEAVTGGSVTIAGGRQIGYATIETNDDDVDEPDGQTFTVAITGVSPASRVLLPRGASIKASIDDNDDPPRIDMTGGDQTVAEGASATFTLTASAASDREYAIPVHVSPGANVFPGDYRAPDRVVFAAGEMEKPFTVEAREDGEEEPEESIVVTLGDEAEPRGWAHIASPRPSATVRIAANTDDTPITVGLESINYSYPEEAKNPIIAVFARRGGRPITDGGTIVVDYELSDVTAESPADYNGPNGSLNGRATIAPGESRVEIPIKFVNDAIVEYIERFRVDLTGASSSRAGATFVLAPTEGQVTITDSDKTNLFLKKSVENPPADEFEVIEVYESAEPVVVRTAVSSTVEYDFTIIVQTMDGTMALAGNDYEYYSRTVTHPQYVPERQIEIAFIDDDVPELVEEFYVSLLRNGLDPDFVITHPVLTIVIQDDDPAFSVSGETRTLEEPAGAGTRAMREVAIAIQSPMPQSVSVDWETSDGSGEAHRVARAGEDFASASGTAVFAPGETETQIRVPILGDGVVEWEKAMRITLKNPSAGGVVADGGALADASEEEVFVVGIADADGPLPITLEVPETVREGESFTVGARIGKPHDLALETSVALMSVSGQATLESDVTMTPNPLVTDFASGTLTVAGSEATVTAIDDNDSEGAETFEVWLRVVREPGGDWPPVEMRERPYRVTIVDNDAAGTPGVTAIQNDGSAVIRQVVQVPEGGTNQIRITLDTPPSKTVTIGWRERDRDGDITVSAAPRHTFDATNWSAPYVIDLSAAEDSDTIEGETFIRLSFETDSPEYEALSDGVDRRAIFVREKENDIDQDGAVSHVGDLPGSPSGVTIADHTIPARHDGRSPVYVEVEFSHRMRASTARMRDHAFEVTGGEVLRAERVEGNAKRWRFRVRPRSAGGQLGLRLNAGTPCGTPTAICSKASPAQPIVNTLWIAIPGPGSTPGLLPPGVAGDPVFDIEGERVNESAGSLDFTVTLSKALRDEASVVFATLNGTARAGDDYESRTEQLVFARGERTKTVTITILPDAIDEGVEAFRGLIVSPVGARIRTAEAAGEIANTGPMPRAWIARFGRTVADQVLDAVGERVGTARASGGSVSLGGRRIGGAAPKADGESEAASASRFGTAEEEDAEQTARLEALSDWLRHETAGNGRADAGSRAWSRTLSGRELLMGSSFSLAAETDGGGFAALWGRMAHTRFAGRKDTLSLDGDVTTGLVGADYASGRWSTGLVVSHSVGEGGYRDESSGEVEATVTALTPWAGYAVNDRLSVWGAAGYGTGGLTLTPADGAALKTDLGMTLAAAGARGTLAGGAGPRLDAVTDARWVRTTTARVSSAAGGNLSSAAAQVTRLRLGLEGSWPLALGDEVLGGGATVTPRLEVGVRHDGGDAETGFGTDIGTGVTLEGPARGLRVSLEGRGVLSHEAAGLRDRGLAGTLAWNPGPAGRGPTLTLRQTLGAGTSGGMDALLGRDTLEGLAANDDGAGRRRLEARFGYGFAMFGGGFTGTPEIGLGQSEAGRDYSVGWRLTGAGSGPGWLELSVEATRRESVNDNDPEHGIGFNASARF